MLAENGQRGAALQRLQRTRVPHRRPAGDAARAGAGRISASRAIRLALRPSDNPVMLGNPSRIDTDVGWQPTIPIEDTLKDLLDYWRRRVAVARDVMAARQHDEYGTQDRPHRDGRLRAVACGLFRGGRPRCSRLRRSSSTWSSCRESPRNSIARASAGVASAPASSCTRCRCSLLVLLFPDRLDIAAAAWGILARRRRDGDAWRDGGWAGAPCPGTARSRSLVRCALFLCGGMAGVVRSPGGAGRT